MIGVVDKSLERLTDLIDDALDLTRIERHVLPLDYKKFDPKSVLTTRLRPFANAAAQKELRLIVRIDPRFPILFWGEPVCFGRVLASLLSNAVKFTSTGHVSVDIGFVDEELVVKVDDTGIGIRQEDQSRVFDLFTQGDSSCTRPYEGTGVGLALVKSILDLLGGSISMQSRVGEGSSFVARFPFEPLLVPFVPLGMRKLRRQVLLLSRELDGNQLDNFADFYGFEVVSEAQVAPERLLLVLFDAAQKSRALEVRAKKTGPMLLFVVGDEPANDGRFRWLHKSLWILEMSEILQQSVVRDRFIGADEADRIARFPHLNVLVIDSDGTDQLVLRKIMEKIECTFCIAPNGDEGLQRLKEGTFDVALLNRHLPLLDGRTVGHAIAKDPNYLKIKIAVLMETGFSQTDFDACKEIGITYFLKKPLTVGNVSDLLVAATRE
jgi:CheY-like chemotaxis protein